MDGVSSPPDGDENDGQAEDGDGDGGDREGEEGEVRVESHTEATMKGIIHTTATIEASGADTAVTETVLAVGAGAQLFPGKGGPYHSSSTPTPTIGDAVQEEVDGVAHDVRVAAGNARDVAGELGAQVVRARAEVEGAAGRLGAREGGERARRGWRSRVFDL
ncbi:hypothetical protein FIBSPDRAFT_901275 [Athelia psychrophila]|nr:hypothetical protein FIBSPDRAFT_901275 [Fibularhizoctonia sp. CBS 109695]